MSWFDVQQSINFHTQQSSNTSHDDSYEPENVRYDQWKKERKKRRREGEIYDEKTP